jgi:hypothetical protein
LYILAAEMCRESIPGLQIDHVDISELSLLNISPPEAGGGPRQGLCTNNNQHRAVIIEHTVTTAASRFPSAAYDHGHV